MFDDIGDHRLAGLCNTDSLFFQMGDDMIKAGLVLLTEVGVEFHPFLLSFITINRKTLNNFSSLYRFFAKWTSKTYLMYSVLGQFAHHSLVCPLFLCYNRYMVRYKATISYDGTLFAGFQRQPKERTVQEELEKTLLRLNSGQAVTVHGAGRTDAGVHAYGQVIHFDLPQARDVEKLRFALDTQGPEDLDILSIEQIADDFHARYWKHSKTYEFLVDNGRPKNPMMRHYATHYPYQLDLAPMQEAIQDLVGTHDFTGFTASGTAVENKVRTITQASLVQDEKTGFLVFTFTGNGFLYKQVRNMVGTLLKIGNGRMPVSQIKTVLASKDRNLAGPTAAGNGLYLKEIIYED